ncbi:alanine--tRNA ligase [Ammonifex thiophilus]|uniref:Alanine--tRNA ligase n=1 Tax=Ammonifex thiophilus TaxID=444093 RepID=A0A3D8P1L2_9THEO|nr:alanine--tRNA ligase [Ammonifex thiophilus]RDV81759.1 alanine--tRNA ligase [Ammonifex thiophilus]
MEGKEIRQRFLDYFRRKDHVILPSAPLIPAGDPSLLWTAAGMVPFKPYFTGAAKPEFRRVATCQKCLRTQDIESVGKTARHLTFFEMLGNFSFGDYFKAEAIAMAWEFVTKELGLDIDRLWFSVFEDDEEAFELWCKMGVKPERIVRLGRDTNFWEIGVGPCGPCSEIYYDFGPAFACGPDCHVGCDCDRYLEIWNLVFIQYYRDEKGNYLPLESKGIDTGMGLERVATVLQGVTSPFATDLFRDIVAVAEQELHLPASDRKIKVVADHVRAVTFGAAEGVLPSNEGRGYVIRRLLRRALLYGVLAGREEPFLGRVAAAVCDKMGEVYPELVAHREHILRVIRAEEERFLTTLSQGMELLNRNIEQVLARGGKVLPGEEAFRLYDTYGFPLELTEEICAEKGLAVDKEGFKREMEAQRERARRARETVEYLGERERFYRELREEKGDIDFVGYELLNTKSRVVALVKGAKAQSSASAGEEVEVVLDVTPFYAEKGGQVSDKGILRFSSGEALVEHVEQPVEGIIVHHVRVQKGELRVGDEVEAVVDAERRRQTARNHTATHLLHRALKEILGPHVKQAGSLVAPDRLRFDFDHYQALTPEEIKRVEKRVNEIVLAALPVVTFTTSLEEAQAMGAVALFGEKYGETVRVVKIGDYSIELCAGTHLRNTAEVGVFKIVAEASVAANTRRIEAVTGERALAYFEELEDDYRRIASLLKAPARELSQRVEALLQDMKALARENEALRDKLALYTVQELLDKVQEVDGVKVLAAKVEAPDTARLRSLADLLREKLGSASVVLLGASSNGKVNLVVAAAPGAVARGINAAQIVKAMAQVVGGGGGGRAEFGQAGGKNPERLGEALRLGQELLRQHLASSR